MCEVVIDTSRHFANPACLDVPWIMLNKIHNVQLFSPESQIDEA